ncbi:hypothetical protein MY1884_003961 [Beauveria asiatica]
MDENASSMSAQIEQFLDKSADLVKVIRSWTMHKTDNEPLSGESRPLPCSCPSTLSKEHLHLGRRPLSKRPLAGSSRRQITPSTASATRSTPAPTRRAPAFEAQTHKTLTEGKFHAKVQLLCQILSQPSHTPPRVVCASKDACFLCNCLLRAHAKLYTPRCHGKLYPAWRLPMTAEFRPLQVALNQMLEQRIRSGADGKRRLAGYLEQPQYREAGREEDYAESCEQGQMGEVVASSIPPNTASKMYTAELLRVQLEYTNTRHREGDDDDDDDDQTHLKYQIQQLTAHEARTLREGSSRPIYI